jgi:hypothetical protein
MFLIEEGLMGYHSDLPHNSISTFKSCLVNASSGCENIMKVKDENSYLYKGQCCFHQLGSIISWFNSLLGEAIG